MAFKRMSGDSRRRQILDAARQCFAQHGYAGTTTKKVAAAASISEGLLFRHFSTKVALHSAILEEACEADPELSRLLKLEPSTATLVFFVQEMIRHFLGVRTLTHGDKGEKIRLTASSLLDDGEFAGSLFEKVGALIAPVFEKSLEQAIAADDVVDTGVAPLHLFWFAHNLLFTVALTRLPERTTLPYPADDVLAHQLLDIILRGLGFTPAALARALDAEKTHYLVSESV